MSILDLGCGANVRMRRRSHGGRNPPANDQSTRTDGSGPLVLPGDDGMARPGDTVRARFSPPKEGQSQTPPPGRPTAPAVPPAPPRHRPLVPRVNAGLDLPVCLPGTRPPSSRLAATSGRQEARVLIDAPSGAHAASPHPRGDTTRTRRLVGLMVGAALLSGLAAAPSAAAATIIRTPDATSPIAPTATVISKPWYSVERFYFGLVNCTRTGGWVLSDGTCRSYGSGRYSAYVAPLTYSYGLSDKVSRPYAKVLAVKGQCSHFIGGSPGDRLKRAGYYRYTWGENIGCRDGYASAKAAVLASHLRFQAEKATGGGHWKNIKNPRFKTLGIGIWRYGTRTRLVTDFYG